MNFPDIKSDMLSNFDAGECAKYKNIYELNTLNPKFKLKRNKYSISSTYDGFVIVNEKFKQFCDKDNYIGLEFIPLQNETEYYWFKINNVLEFDTKQRGTEFLNYNPSCDGYEEIIGATPVCLKSNEKLGNGFYRTDICFGSYAGKSPIYLVGVDAKEKLIGSGFKEIYFEEIHDKYAWENN